MQPHRSGARRAPRQRDCSVITFDLQTSVVRHVSFTGLVPPTSWSFVSVPSSNWSSLRLLHLVEWTYSGSFPSSQKFVRAWLVQHGFFTTCKLNPNPTLNPMRWTLSRPSEPAPKLLTGVIAELVSQDASQEHGSPRLAHLSCAVTAEVKSWPPFVWVVVKRNRSRHLNDNIECEYVSETRTEAGGFLARCVRIHLGSPATGKRSRGYTWPRRQSNCDIHSLTTCN